MKIDISQLPKNVMYSSAELRMHSYSDCCKTEEITVNDIYSVNNTNLSTEFNFDNVNGTSSYNKRFLSTQEQVSSTLYSFDILNAIKKDDDNIIYLEFSADRFTVNDVQALFIGYNNATYSPKIVLKYYETSGLKDYWTYHSSNLGNAGTMYINDFSGNLVIERVDYENPSERISFNLVQYYNSFESEVNIGYGNGWRFNYSDFIKEFTSVTGVTSSNYYTHIDGTGHKSYYKYLPTEDDTVDQFVCEDGDDSIIELGIAASGSNYCEMIVDGEYYYDYKSNGGLHFIQKNDDSNFSTTINFEHSSLSNGQRVLYLIVDAVGNRAKFIYNENDLLEKIVIEKKKIENEISSLNIAYQIFFSYDSYGNLIEVVKKANEDDCIQTKVRYSYDSNNKLIEMKNYFTGNSSIINESINFTYDSNNEKINSYYYSNSNLLSNFPNVEITYGVYKTIFETSDGYKSYYSFDRFGHTINIYDNDGYAKFYKYEFDNENNFLNNKLIEESESVFYKYNKITNHGFENYDSNNLIIGWSTRGNASLNSTNRLYGEYALKLSSTSSSASQTIQLYGNTTYQLSAFIKVKEMDDYVNGGAYIEIKANDENGSIITSQSEYIAPNGKFEEYIKEFTVGGYEHCPYQVTISLKTSINTDVYFDNVQLVMGINDCRYNMLEDNSFENSFLASNSKWIGGSTCECEPNEEFGFYYRYIPSNTILKQTLDVSISKGTKLSFGGFVNSNGSKASIRLRFYNIETDTYSDYYTIGYSKDVSDFQYLMENVEVSLDGGCHQIEFEVVNNGRYGIYVDNLILMQDIFTNTYKYNIVGKPEIIKSYEKQFEFVRDTETNRKIEKIIIKKSENTTVINYEESSSQQTVNIDGSINNITTTVYSDINQMPVATVIGTTDSKYFTNTTEYSHLNQFITKRTNEFNNSTSYEYDYLNGLITKVTDAKNIDTAYEYDYYERIIKIVKNSNVIEYSYNNIGQIEKIKTGNDTVYIEYYFEYNEYFDIKKISTTSNVEDGYKTIIEYEYYIKDELYTGKIKKIINANGSYVLYEYDNDLRINEVWKKLQNETNEVLIVKYTYNESNNVSVFYDGRINTTYYYSYDLKGNLMQIIDSNHNKILYTYDNDSNVVKIEYTIDGETDVIYYGYDAEGNMNSIISNGLQTSYEDSQDPLGRYFYKSTKNSIEQPIINYYYSYYNSINTALSTIDDKQNLASNRLMEQIVVVGDYYYSSGYSYDELGNVIEYYQAKGHSQELEKTEKLHKYTYDNYNQLIKEEVYLNSTQILCCNYTYDILGNIISIQRPIKLEEYQNLPSNITYFYEDEMDKTKLTKYEIDGQTYILTYDSYNNLTNLDNYDITFLDGKITSLSFQDIDQVRYTYDVTGRRIKKEIYNQNTLTYDVINYVYLNDVLIKEIHNDKTITYILDDTGVIGFKVKTATTENTYYYAKNTQNDIIAIVDEDLNEVANYIYDAYGNIVNIEAVNQNEIAKLNPYRYRSYYYDNETNLFLVSSRYYSPELCRFISPDDIEYLDAKSVNGLNLYCYCLNNPIMYVDPDGHMPKWAQWVVGGLAVAGLIVATVLTCGAAGAGAAAVGTAMLVGGVVSGGIEIIDQLHDTGTVDWTSVAISTLSGTAYGLVIGLTGGTGAWAVAGKFAVAGGTSLLNSWNEWDENSTFGGMMASFALSLAVSGVAQGAGYLTGKFGPKVLSKLMPKNPNHLITMGDIGSYLWGIPAVKTGVIRFAGGVAGSIFNDYF